MNSRGTPSEELEQMLSERPVYPYHILAITFTNKAAGELKNRLSAMLGQAGQDVHASTFHSACVRMLRRDADRLGYPKSFTIYDTDDQQRAMKDIYKTLSIDEKFLPLKASLSAIGRMKDKMISPRDAIAEAKDVRSTSLARVYEAYQKKLFSAFTVKRALPDDIPEKLAVPAPRPALPPKRAAIASRKINGADIAIYFPEDYFDRKGYEDFLSGDAPEKYLYLPAFLKGKEIEKISEFVGGFDGVYGMNLSAIGIAESPGVKLFMGTGFNIFNSVSAGEAAKKCSYYAYSSELTAREAAAIGGGFYPGAGAVKVMDFIHCPYGGHCAGCSAPDIGILTDEEGREFPLRRYKTVRCAFALYNSRNISAKSAGSVLCDYTLMREKEINLDSARRASENEPHTAGRSVKGVI